MPARSRSAAPSSALARTRRSWSGFIPRVSRMPLTVTAPTTGWICQSHAELESNEDSAAWIHSGTEAGACSSAGAVDRLDRDGGGNRTDHGLQHKVPSESKMARCG
jgi:hypothetical protein